MTHSFQLDSRLDGFVTITEVADASRLAAAVLRRKYNMDVPPHGHHVIAFVAGETGCWWPAFYVNYLPHRNAMLIGGAATDGEVLRRLGAHQQAALAESDGLMLQTVRYSEARFADESVGTFGYCGDERSWSILQRCGYRRIGDHAHLIVRWNRQLPEVDREELIDSVRELGPF
ncbi:hypothetical protein IC757_12920 [Wenzhouxiangella sp. AB-CW3]|uniref:hypothetical protein n=1 Tax=Wenzhouxiangella sp. AB-CW3 TaxID=2771012 RepID=UPI00168AE7F3|nr:hypothetical protein [Wenzhouxiangella sp. AB-CW3]QOC21923.1 hypothetical protein IC757_12920 [Wenzhouxiangella sp. AB-CW3]